MLVISEQKSEYRTNEPLNQEKTKESIKPEAPKKTKRTKKEKKEESK